MTEAEYKKLKSDVDEAKTESDRAKGALDQLMVRLKDEFECTTVKEAKVLLQRLQFEKETAQATLDKASKEYKKKWKPDD